MTSGCRRCDGTTDGWSHSDRGQRGSGTLLVVAVLAVVLALAAALSVLAGYAAAGHRARAAADLAAVSAATAYSTGGDACTVAAELARRNGAALQRCVVTGAGQFVVTVEVSVAVTAVLPGLPRSVVTRAYAGSASLAGTG